MKELTITVKVAERPYRLKVMGEEEETVRRASDSINEKIKEYANQYAFNDRQDLLAMVAMHFAIQSLNAEVSAVQASSAIGDRIRKLDEVISKHMG